MPLCFFHMCVWGLIHSANKIYLWVLIKVTWTWTWNTQGGIRKGSLTVGLWTGLVLALKQWLSVKRRMSILSTFYVTANWTFDFSVHLWPRFMITLVFHSRSPKVRVSYRVNPGIYLILWPLMFLASAVCPAELMRLSVWCMKLMHTAS